MATSLKNKHWTKIKSAFPILSDNNQRPETCDDETFERIKDMIKDKKLTVIISENVMYHTINNISSKMIDSFWLNLLDEEIIELNVLRKAQECLPTDITVFKKFINAINGVFKLAQLHIPAIKRLQILYKDDEINMLNLFYKKVGNLIYSQLPINYKTIVYNFYRTGLRILYFEGNADYFDENSIQCFGCCVEKPHCNCEFLIKVFSTANWQLRTIGIMESLIEEVVLDLVHTIIENEVTKRTKDNFEDSALPILCDWISDVLLSWIRKILDPRCNSAIYDDSKLKSICNKLKCYLNKFFTKIRISQIYDILIRFPHSEPVIDDLMVSIMHLDIDTELPELRILLQNSFEKKLLQPNISPTDIVCVYTTAIKVLKQIDPSGTLIQEVTQLIRENLRGHEDFIQQVTMILSKRGGSSRGRIFTRRNVNLFRTIIDECSTILNSLPSNSELESIVIPNTAETSTVGQLSFCSHYPKVNKSYNDMEIQSLLKIFDEPLLQIYAEEAKETSRPVENYIYDLPLRYEYTSYFNNTSEFHLIYKKHRTITWKPNIETVEIFITPNIESLSINVLPIHVTVIWNFQHQEEWTLDDLSSKMIVSATELINYITFWIDQGILKRKSFDAFVLSDNFPKYIPDCVLDDNKRIQIEDDDDSTLI